MRRFLTAGASVLTLALFSTAAMAELAISANDGKQARAGDTPPGVTKDYASVIQFGQQSKPMEIGRIDVPATVIGPPTSVAVAPDYSFAIIDNAQKFDASNKLVPDGVVSVIGLDDPTHPKLLQSLAADPGAAGVSINRKGTLAMVAAMQGASVTAYAIADRHLTETGKIKFDPKADARDVVFAPDGKTAYVVLWGAGKIAKIAITGTGISQSGEIAVGVQPDNAVISPDGRYLYNTNFGGMSATEKTGAVSAVDLKTGKLVGSVEVGAQPEHVAMSPDGKYLAVTVGNGAATQFNGRNFEVLSKVKVLKPDGAKLSVVAEADTAHYCQGVTFSDDAKTILAQCALEKEIETLRFDGKSLTRDKDATLKFQSRPGGIATARSR
jgi:DNA-binding beta-propeller fold protein YncE